jgi:hypothetical protein
VNALDEVLEPPAVCTEIAPVDAVKGTVAAAFVGDDTTTEVLATPLKLTVIGATKFVPVIVTGAPSLPDAGEKALIVGAAANALAAQSGISARKRR